MWHFGKSNKTRVLEVLSMRRFALLTHIALPRKFKFGKKGASDLSKAVPSLESLDLGFTAYGQHINAEQLMSIARDLPGLKGIGLELYNVTAGGLEGFLREAGPSLTDLHLSDLVGRPLPPSTWAAIAAGCPNLQSLTVRNTAGHMRTAKADVAPSTNVLIELVAGCPNLKSLNLLGLVNGIDLAGFAAHVQAQRRAGTSSLAKVRFVRSKLGAGVAEGVGAVAVTAIRGGSAVEQLLLKGRGLVEVTL
jgi:hypothetical protein